LRVWAEADKVAKELQKTMKPLEDEVQSRWAADEAVNFVEAASSD
jgi:membrane dipeptidase